MNKSFVFLIKRPKDFEVKNFKENFTREMEKLGVNICSIIQWKEFGVELEDDILNFQFETDYDFGVQDKDPYAVGEIYERILDIKRKFNTENDSKIIIGPIILINYL